MKRRGVDPQKVEQESRLKKLMDWQAAELAQKLDEIQIILDRTEAEAQVITQAAREGR